MARKRDVLVVGGGIAGTQTALLLAEKDRNVFLMDRAPAIGGFFPLLDKQFPTNSCGVCFMSPNPPALCPIYESDFHENIKLLTNCDIDKVDGKAGDFSVEYTQRATCVDTDKCNLCGKCTQVCPEETSSEFGGGLEKRKAIYLPFPQAIPRSYVIDRETCTKCGKCVEACKPGAINLEAKDKKATLEPGAIVLGFGFEAFKAEQKGEFGLGRYPNVVSAIQYERMLNSSSPTNGIPLKNSDGSPVKKVAFLQCVGSRDKTCGQEFCSSVCCMFATKQAMISSDRVKGLKASIFYMDVRAFGKNYEQYYQKAKNEYGVAYTKCAVSMVRENKKDNSLAVTYGLENGDVKIENFDMVVLSTGFTGVQGVKATAEKLGVELNSYNYCKTDEFNPTKTSVDGIYVAGAFREPRDIPETVVEACSAAADVSALLDAEGPDNVSAESTYLDTAGLRTAVFFCESRGLLAGTLDLDALSKDLKTRPNVKLVEKINVSSAFKAAAAIREKAEAENINRIILAGYKGLNVQHALRKSCPGAHANVIDIVNIGEQCVDVHQANKAAAQEKAGQLLDAGLLRTWGEFPAKIAVHDVNGGVVVIGGGIAGMTASLALADQGLDVTLVEKESELGGLARTSHYTIKGGDIQKELKNLISKTAGNSSISVMTESELSSLSGTWGGFTSTIKGKDGEKEINHGAIILATGGYELKPKEYLYGENSSVITQREFDTITAKDIEKVKKASTVVMIQCVGSRNEENPYCSRVCCTHAVKNALKIKEINPDAKVYVLYRDMRTYGFFEKYYEKARSKGVMFIRFDIDSKPKVAAGGNSLNISFNDPVIREKITLAADLLILSAGVKPNDISGLSETAGIQLDESGFYKESNAKAAPLDAIDRGKFFAGIGHSPMLIEEAICQGKAAAARASALLWNKQKLLPETQSYIRAEACTGCGQCVQVCPYDALSLDPQTGLSTVNEALCRGCGTCAGTCRVGAIDIRSFSDLQLINVLNAL